MQNNTEMAQRFNTESASSLSQNIGHFATMAFSKAIELSTRPLQAYVERSLAAMDGSIRFHLGAVYFEPSQGRSQDLEQ